MVDDISSTTLILVKLRQAPVLRKVGIWGSCYAENLFWVFWGISCHIKSKYHCWEICKRKLVNCPWNKSKLGSYLSNHFVDYASETLVFLYGANQDHLWRHWKFIDHKSFYFVIIYSLIFFAWQDPKTDTDLRVEIFLCSLVAVSFIFDLLDWNLSIILDTYFVVVKNSLKHFFKLSRLILISLFCKNCNCAKAFTHIHFSLAFSHQICSIFQGYIFVSKYEISRHDLLSITSLWSGLNTYLPLI